MTQHRTLVWLIGLSWSGMLAHAQAIDPGPASAVIGQPLDMRVLVRPAPDLGGARFDRRCIHVDARIGDRWVKNSALQVEIGRPDEDGLYGVRLRHASPVDEPIVKLRVGMICGATYEREFDILAMPVHRLPDADVKTKSKAAPSRRNSTELHSTTTFPPIAIEATSNPPQIKKSTSAAPPPNVGDLENLLATAPTSTGTPDSQAMLRSIIKLLQSTDATDSIAPLASSDVRFDPIKARETADLNYLAQELSRLRQEQQQASTAIASLQARLAQADANRWTQSIWTASAALATLIGFGLLVLVGDAVLPAVASRLRRRHGPDDLRDRTQRDTKQGSETTSLLQTGQRVPNSAIDEPNSSRVPTTDTDDAHAGSINFQSPPMILDLPACEYPPGWNVEGVVEPDQPSHSLTLDLPAATPNDDCAWIDARYERSNHRSS
ncbi:MAG: hypothetical protein RIQ60_3196 [Pseudomonadota bacterium]